MARVGQPDELRRRVIGNSLPGWGAGSASEGAGLGAVRGDCGSPTFTATATATNLVAAGNSIGAPSGGDVEGAGVYAGCTATTGTQGFQLTLIESTVSGNSGPGGAAGVDGESGDTLTVQNSIVAGNTGAGATDVGGFGATPGATSPPPAATSARSAPPRRSPARATSAPPRTLPARQPEMSTRRPRARRSTRARTRSCRAAWAPTSTDSRGSSAPRRLKGSSTSVRLRIRPPSPRRAATRRRHRHRHRHRRPRSGMW